MKYVLSPGAELDLYEIWGFIAQDNVTVADRWIGKLFNAFAMISRNPGIGHKRSDLTKFPVLFWPVGTYIIIYRVGEKWLEIVAVTRGSRDIPSLLRKRVVKGL